MRALITGGAGFSLVGFRPTVQLDEILGSVIEHFRTSTAK